MSTTLDRALTLTRRGIAQPAGRAWRYSAPCWPAGSSSAAYVAANVAEPCEEAATAR